MYTKTGDDGTTGRFFGGRARKDEPVIEASGAIDEAVAALGMARAEAGSRPELAELLARLQREMFVVGAEVNTEVERRDRLEDGRTRVTMAMVTALEPLIDAGLVERPLENRFVLPGGTRLSAALDLARVTVRSAERRVIAALEGQPAGPAVQYLNRLSDLLFVLARVADDAPPEYL